MTFSDDLRAFTLKVQTRSAEVFSRTVDKTHDSIQNGSAATGAPGQPVDTGNLKASWQKSFEDATHATVSTNVEYAGPIEDGIGPHGPLTLRSPVGGFHSVALTRANFGRLVEEANREATGA